mgnify:FL=1|jgi:hypothetical protein
MNFRFGIKNNLQLLRELLSVVLCYILSLAAIESYSEY